MLTRLTRRLRDYRSRKIAASHLARMDDRGLADIGVNRSDIDLVVSKGRLGL